VLGQSKVPQGLSEVIAIAAGAYNSLALKSDGTVVAWGRKWRFQSPPNMAIPEGLSGVTAIAAGGNIYGGYSLALKNDGAVFKPSIRAHPQSQIISRGQSVLFTAIVGGTPPFTFQWFREGAANLGRNKRLSRPQ